MDIFLAPCPVCGGDTASFYQPSSGKFRGDGGYYIRCEVCHMARMKLYTTQNNAVKYWNKFNNFKQEDAVANLEAK